MLPRMSERRSVHRHLAVERPTVWPRRRVGATLALASLLAGLSLSGIACSHPASVAGIAADGVIPKSASLDPGQRLRFQSSLVPDSESPASRLASASVAPTR